MEQTTSKNPPDPFRYESTWKRVAASFLGANIVVLMGHKVPFLESFTHKNYYFDTLASFGVAVAMIETVHHFTIRLDIKYPWNKDPSKRLRKLLGYCIMLPLLIDTAGMGIYYYARYQVININKQYWYNKYLPEAAILLILLNFYYYSQFRKVEKREAEERETQNRLLKNKLASALPHSVNSLKDAVYYYKIERKVFAMLSNGERILTHYSALLEIPLDPEVYIQPTRTEITSWANIVKIDKSGRNFIITLKVPEKHSVTLSRELSSKFRKELSALTGR